MRESLEIFDTILKKNNPLNYHWTPKNILDYFQESPKYPKDYPIFIP